MGVLLTGVEPSLVAGVTDGSVMFKEEKTKHTIWWMRYEGVALMPFS